MHNFASVTISEIIHLVSGESEPTPKPDRGTFREHIRALPLVEDGPDITLNQQDVLAILADLEQSGSRLPENIRLQMHTVFASLVPELPRDPNDDSSFVLTSQQLRGVIARATLAGAARVSNDVGARLLLSQELETLLLPAMPPEQAETPDVSHPNDITT